MPNNRPFTAAPPKGWRIIPSGRVLIHGGRVIDPYSRRDENVDIQIENGMIKQVGAIKPSDDCESLDVKGCIVCPGLFDMHVHLREPGYEHKETVVSGCFAAAAGGFTGVACMPNTDPPIDNPGVVRFIRDRAYGLPVDVHPIAATTRGRRGEALSEIAELCDAGVTGFSDDGSPVQSAAMMRHALEYAKMFDAVIIEHCEDRALAGNGAMHEGETSTLLGLPGWPSVAEEIAVGRNIRLAEFTGGRLHICHVSTAGSVELIRDAKKRGIDVTAEATPHHLTLDCSLLKEYNTDYKINPPLRTGEDIDALIEGVADGTIDALATDHSPHAPDEKEVEFIDAPFGMIGLGTALAVILTKLVSPGRAELARIIDALTVQPRRILRLPDIPIEPMFPANITLIDPAETWVVDREHTLSKSRNTPFHGWKLTGRARGIINNGVGWLRET